MNGNEGPSIQVLGTRRNETSHWLQREYRRLQTWGWATVAALMLTAPVAGEAFPIPKVFAWPLAVIACACLAITMIKRARVRTARDELRRIDFQIDLLRASPTPDEERAEKLLNINEYTLRQYYDLALSQSTWIFSIGVLCLLSGLGIAGITMHLLHSPRANSAGVERWPEQVALALVGVVGTVLISYVAAIYLKMHASTATSLVNLHARLVGSHQLYFANLLASRVPEAQQANVLSKMALHLVAPAKDVEVLNKTPKGLDGAA